MTSVSAALNDPLSPRVATVSSPVCGSRVVIPVTCMPILSLPRSAPAGTARVSAGAPAPSPRTVIWRVVRSIATMRPDTGTDAAGAVTGRTAVTRTTPLAFT